MGIITVWMVDGKEARISLLSISRFLSPHDPVMNCIKRGKEMISSLEINSLLSVGRKREREREMMKVRNDDDEDDNGMRGTIDRMKGEKEGLTPNDQL